MSAMTLGCGPKGFPEENPRLPPDLQGATDGTGGDASEAPAEPAPETPAEPAPEGAAGAEG